MEDAIEFGGAPATAAPAAVGVSKRAHDPIHALQEQFAVLGQTYAAALRQCEQGGRVADGEVVVDAQRIQTVLKTTLAMVDSLPDDTDTSDDVFDALVKEDAVLTALLQQEKQRAEQAVDKIRKMRLDLAQEVLQGAVE